MLYDYISPYDSTVVRMLIHESGSLMTGKTNMDEFAIGSGNVDSAFGPCLNPWKSGLPFSHDPDCSLPSESTNQLEHDCYVPGGSSGGSAVAVATGSVFAALGSDTGGSTRYPAALTGVVGFKPTYGLISRHGLVPLSHSLDTVGILTRCVEDAQHVFQRLQGFDEMDSTCVRAHLQPVSPDLDLKSVRIGVAEEYLVPGMSSEVLDLVNEMCNKLSNAGASVEKVSLPHTKYATSCYTILNSVEIASNFACFDGVEYGYRADEEAVAGGKSMSREELFEVNRSQGFGDPVKGRIHAGNYFLLKDNYNKYVLPAYQMRRLILEDLMRVLKGKNECVDVILTPITRGTAHRCSDWITRDNRELAAQEDFCTQPANLSGLPAITIPCIIARNGLPLGLQLIASPLDDNLLLAVALQMQKLLNFHSLKFQPS